MKEDYIPLEARLPLLLDRDVLAELIRNDSYYPFEHQIPAELKVNTVPLSDFGFSFGNQDALLWRNKADIIAMLEHERIRLGQENHTHAACEAFAEFRIEGEHLLLIACEHAMGSINDPTSDQFSEAIDWFRDDARHSGDDILYFAFVEVWSTKWSLPGLFMLLLPVAYLGFSIWFMISRIRSCASH